MRPRETRARREVEDLNLKSFVQLFPEAREGVCYALPVWHHSYFLRIFLTNCAARPILTCRGDHRNENRRCPPCQYQPLLPESSEHDPEAARQGRECRRGCGRLRAPNLARSSSRQRRGVHLHPAYGIQKLSERGGEVSLRVCPWQGQGDMDEALRGWRACRYASCSPAQKGRLSRRVAVRACGWSSRRREARHEAVPRDQIGRANV